MVDEVTREDLDELKDCIEQNTRTLRGSNGNPGIVTDVEIVKKDVKEIKDNHLVHIQQSLHDGFENLTQVFEKEVGLVEVTLKAYIDRKFAEKSRSVMNDWVRPILLPVIISIVSVLLTLSQTSK